MQCLKLSSKCQNLFVSRCFPGQIPKSGCFEMLEVKKITTPLLQHGYLQFFLNCNTQPLVTTTICRRRAEWKIPFFQAAYAIRYLFKYFVLFLYFVYKIIVIIFFSRAIFIYSDDDNALISHQRGRKRAKWWAHRDYGDLWRCSKKNERKIKRENLFHVL